MIFMVCYDICDPARLRRTASILENFGIRIQYSFFQCEMEKNRMESMRDAILKELELKKDNIFIYPLCEDCARKPLTDGAGEVLKISTFEII